MVAGTWAGPESEQLQEAVISFIKTEAAHPGPVCTGPASQLLLCTPAVASDFPAQPQPGVVWPVAAAVRAAAH